MEYPSFTEESEERAISKKLYYENTQEDYMRFEDYKKQHLKPPIAALALLACMTLFTIYEIHATKSVKIIGLWIFILGIYFFLTLIKRYSGSEKTVKKYIDADPYYKSGKSVAFLEETALFTAFKKEDGVTLFKAAYPYSLMDSIVVTVEDYYFIIGGQAFILPRRYTKAFGDDTALLDKIKQTGKMVDER